MRSQPCIARRRRRRNSEALLLDRLNCIAVALLGLLIHKILARARLGQALLVLCSLWTAIQNRGGIRVHT